MGEKWYKWTGKTIIGLSLVAERQQPTLIIVHRKQLFDQWIERIQTFLKIPSHQIGRIAGLIQQHFEIGYCISSTEWLGEFSLHQAFRHIVLLEVEKEFLTDVFDLLRTKGNKEVYLSPNNQVFSLYVLSADAPIILKPLPSRAPVREVSTIKVSSLEKMLVDLSVDSQTFYAYQGREMLYVFEKAIQLYQINYTRLFSYAERRKKRDILRQFLREHIADCPKSLLDD